MGSKEVYKVYYLSTTLMYNYVKYVKNCNKDEKKLDKSKKVWYNIRISLKTMQNSR